jgi:hypothetical protein
VDRALRALVFAMLLASPWSAPAAHAQNVVTSATPDHISVTLYRAPYRRPENGIESNDLQGFALITETRTVDLPAGPAVIRFEGVAGNILPESALVGGLPQAVEEKNLDADLLSPRSLFDRALGRRVMIRRTDPGTGKVLLQQATIRSSSDGAAVLELGGHFGDLRCSGLPEALVYDGIPEGLSAKPTLSVRTTSPVPQRVTLTLSYLAGGFDWQADYVVTMRSDGRSADMFAWITLASSDVTTFPNADLQVIAGRLNRTNDNVDRADPGDGALSLKCWPMPVYYLFPPTPPPPSPPPEPVSAPQAGVMDIIVTGSAVRRDALQAMPVAVVANAETLGDLRLYRFPKRVTVASNATKQVAMLSKPAIKLRPVYVSTVDDDNANTTLVMRGKNVAANGLGIALPAGRAAFFANADGHTLLVGESSTDDKTLGEDVEFDMGEPGSVDANVDETRDDDRNRAYVLTVTNSNPWPIAYEAKLRSDDGNRLVPRGRKLEKKDGGMMWSVTVPANGKMTLRWSVKVPKDKDDQ